MTDEKNPQTDERELLTKTLQFVLSTGAPPPILLELFHEGFGVFVHAIGFPPPTLDPSPRQKK